MHDHVGDQRVVTVARRFEGEFARPRLARRGIARIGKRAAKRARQRLDIADRNQCSVRWRGEDFGRPAAIRRDDDSTEAIYGHDVSTRHILRGEVAVPSVAESFLDAVRNAKAKAIASN